MGSVTTSTSIEADIQAVFDYVADYRTAIKYSHDLKKWEPVTDVTDDIGAQFDVTLQLGPKAFDSRVEVNSRTDPEQFGWSSISGFQHSGKYTFSAAAEGRTDVTFEFDYTLPGGMAGRLLGRTFDPMLKASLGHNLKTLKKQVEEQARTSG
ncbi:MAG TPA: SRPBCC family protein [Frankiaceae bacterium]|nr:SRPBCC family protein [Frankiaceae bacterium]